VPLSPQRACRATAALTRHRTLCAAAVLAPFVANPTPPTYLGGQVVRQLYVVMCAYLAGDSRISGRARNKGKPAAAAKPHGVSGCRWRCLWHQRLVSTGDVAQERDERAGGERAARHDRFAHVKSRARTQARDAQKQHGSSTASCRRHEWGSSPHCVEPQGPCPIDGGKATSSACSTT
jgi:hypothetical protein